MPPAPRRSSTSPGPGAGAANVSIRRSSFAWMRAASIVDLLRAQGPDALMQRVPALAEALVRLVEVALHRRARAGRVVARDRAQHGAVLGHRGGPQLRRIVVVLELLVERAGALVPQHLDDLHERAVAGGLRDAHVEHPVAAERLPAVA